MKVLNKLKFWKKQEEIFDKEKEELMDDLFDTIFHFSKTSFSKKELSEISKKLKRDTARYDKLKASGKSEEEIVRIERKDFFKPKSKKELKKEQKKDKERVQEIAKSLEIWSKKFTNSIKKGKSIKEFLKERKKIKKRQNTKKENQLIKKIEVIYEKLQKVKNNKKKKELTEKLSEKTEELMQIEPKKIVVKGKEAENLFNELKKNPKKFSRQLK